LVDLRPKGIFLSVSALTSPSTAFPSPPPEISSQTGVVAPRAEIQLPDLPYAIVSFLFFFLPAVAGLDREGVVMPFFLCFFWDSRHRNWNSLSCRPLRCDALLVSYRRTRGGDGDAERKRARSKLAFLSTAPHSLPGFFASVSSSFSQPRFSTFSLSLSLLPLPGTTQTNTPLFSGLPRAQDLEAQHGAPLGKAPPRLRHQPQRPDQGHRPREQVHRRDRQGHLGGGQAGSRFQQRGAGVEPHVLLGEHEPEEDQPRSSPGRGHRARLWLLGELRQGVFRRRSDAVRLRMGVARHRQEVGQAVDPQDG